MHKTILRTIPAILAAAAFGAPAFAQEADAALADRGDASAAAPAGPGLWKVSDEDTTIYLMGTIHILPGGLDWFEGPIAQSFESADTYVTELRVDPEGQAALAAASQRFGTLPPETDLRSLLSEEQRAQYEAALGEIGLPVAALDRLKPWLAGTSIAFIPLMQQGYDIERSPEKILFAQAGAKSHEALETPEFQFGVFDAISREDQIEMLMDAVRGLDEARPMFDEMVALWMAGDADGLARYMNEHIDDQEVYELLLTNRNADWAAWIDERLETVPGTVFIAVGAGHLAGEQSVQDMLAERGLFVTRVQ